LEKWIENICAKYIRPVNGHTNSILLNFKQNSFVQFVGDFYRTPYSYDGKAFDRKESSTSLMTRNRYQQLLVSQSVSPTDWELKPLSDITIEDLDSVEIIRTLKEGIEKKHIDSALDTTDIKEILTRFRLLTKGRPNNGAAVLFLKEVPGEFMQCIIRMARFKGVKKGVFIDSKHFIGNAFQVFQEAENFVNRNTAVSSHVEEGKMVRVDEPEYPFKAIRESLINAICHRDYSTRSGSVTMTIYDDRIEIASTGLLLNDIIIEDLQKTHTSHPRNPNILNVFYLRGLIEAMGIGTQEIIDVCKAAHMNPPQFYEQSGTFVVKLWSRHQLKIDVRDTTFTDRQAKILGILQNHEGLSPQEILTLLDEDVSDRTLRRDLQILKKWKYIDNKGQLGPKTTWFVLKT